MKKNKTMLTTTMVAGVLVMQGIVSNAQSNTSNNQESKEAIRPFKVHIPQKDLTDLKNRIKTARWTDKEIVPDQTQGVQLVVMRKLADYWLNNYDWRKAEARLNALPQFVTNIDGVDIYFIHVRSKHPNALPLIMTHGWPGSIFENLDVIAPLTDPTAYGGKPEDAFDIVIPSMPGYGFSGKPTTTGWNTEHIARAWVVLMERLGYSHYVAQGGDWGSPISAAMARLAPKGLLAIHINLPQSVPLPILGHISKGDPAPAELSEQEKRAYEQIRFVFAKGRGYIAIQGSHPQTLGYGLGDSPVGLAAWLIDHDADSYKKIYRSFAEGKETGSLTRDGILDNITLYWFTNTATSAARLYWEETKPLLAAIDISLPTAVTVFAGEVYQAPRSWVEKSYHNLVYFNEVDKGGHFAAWEEPQLMTEELRAAFKSFH